MCSAPAGPSNACIWADAISNSSGSQILVVIEHLRQRNPSRSVFTRSQTLDVEVVMDSGVALGGQARAQQKKLARLRRRAKGLPMNLEEFRIGGISLIKKMGLRAVRD